MFDPARNFRGAGPVVLEMRFLFLSAVLVAGMSVGPSSAGTAVADPGPPPMKWEGRLAPSATRIVSDAGRFVAFEVRRGGRQPTRIIDTRKRKRFRVRPPAGCSADNYEFAGLVAVGGGNLLWNCLPDPGVRSSHNTRKDAWLFDLSARKFGLAAGMAEMRACYDSFDWVGVGSRWAEAAVGEHACDGTAAGPHYLDHRTGEVVAEQHPPRSDQAPDLDAETPLQALCSGVRRRVTAPDPQSPFRDYGYSVEPFQFERGFGIGTYVSRGALRLQRCAREPRRLTYCRDSCRDVQLGRRFLTWLDERRGVYAYSLATRQITRWKVPDVYGVAHTHKRIFVIGPNRKVRSARLPRPTA